MISNYAVSNEIFWESSSMGSRMGCFQAAIPPDKLFSPGI